MAGVGLWCAVGAVRSLWRIREGDSDCLCLGGRVFMRRLFYIKSKY
jgi:hypothetical protein